MSRSTALGAVSAASSSRGASDTQSRTLSGMYDVMVQTPGGGWSTDTTASLTRCRDRVRDLAASNRRPQVITRIWDRRDRRNVPKETR